MNFNLDDKQIYLSERRILKRMPLANLKKLVGELYVQRFDNNDIELDGYYRLATSVLLDRKENKTSLIFHLQNFIPFVGLLLFINKVVNAKAMW